MKMTAGRYRQQPGSESPPCSLPGIAGGFSLTELMVGIAILSILCLLGYSTLQKLHGEQRQMQCMNTLRALGQAMHLYSLENEGRFPRSFHSAATHRESGWALSIAPYLGVPEPRTPEEWKTVFNRYYRSAKDPNRDVSLYSYGMNVFLELTPDGDDYEGSPQTWRRHGDVPNPSHTILLAEIRPGFYLDHFMCHQWSSLRAAQNAVAYDRNENGTSNYLFVDGHVEALPIEATFNPTNGINHWNPAYGH